MNMGIKDLVLSNFIQKYLLTIRRFSSLLPKERRNLLPEFWHYPYKILVTTCEDGIAIEFKRKISKKQDSIRIRHNRFLNDINTKFTGLQVLLPADGKSGIVVENLAITTESCFRFLNPGGTLWKIPDHFGLFRVASGGDIMLNNVGLFYIDRSGFPKQFTFRGMWIIANDSPSLFTAESAQKRGLMDFLRRLVQTGAIIGRKKKRYTEFDIASEIKTVKREYLTLMNSEGIDEAEVQKFLEEHKFILSPLYLDISSKTIKVKPQMELPAIGRKVDFVLMQELNLIECKVVCTAIEIKKPSDKLFLRNGKMSQPLREGIDQINAILKFVDLDLMEAKKYLPVSAKSDLKGIVLIGRRKELSAEDMKSREEFNEANDSIKIVFFDDLLKNIDCVSRVFGKKLQRPAVVVGQTGAKDEDFTGKTGEVIQEAIDFLSKRIDKEE